MSSLLRRMCAVPFVVAAALGLPALAVEGAAARSEPDAHDAPASDPLDVVASELRQSGTDLVLRVRTAHGWHSAALDRSGHRSLCLGVVRRNGGATSRICAAELHGSLRAWSAAPSGAAVLRHVVRGATVARPSETVIVMRVPASAAKLAPGSFGWSVRTTWSGAGCTPTAACRDLTPDRGLFRARLRRVVHLGCRVSGRPYRSGGSPSRRVVALTFDDGPAGITPHFLQVLERERVPATFFLLGRQIRGHEALLRRMLSDGFALGDHTMSHANVSSGGPATEHEVRGPIGIIQHATGYRPCLFRAPYGAVSGGLISRARSLGMATIEWNVDPRDWSRPGTGAIVSRVLSQTRPGSIIIMHDGGGPRRQTLAALPRVIYALRARGYRFVTVPRLLGFAERTALR